MQSTGYASREYAQSLESPDRIIDLPSSGGLLIREPIGETGLSDARGCYPVFSCGQWGGLRNDIASLGRSLVSVRLVTDPLAGIDLRELSEAFTFVRPFKRHFVVEGGRQTMSPHHAREVRRAIARVRIERVLDPETRATQWERLYRGLCLRRKITGPAAFARESLGAQLSLPGMYVYAAICKGSVCGMALWYRNGPHAYYHLAASDGEGLRMSAAYALVRYAIDDLFQEGVKKLCLGAGAGVTERDDGLSRFKSGWSSSVEPTYFCGSVLNTEVYRDLAGSSGEESEYFPGYRQPTGKNA